MFITSIYRYWSMNKYIFIVLACVLGIASLTHAALPDNVQIFDNGSRILIIGKPNTSTSVMTSCINGICQTNGTTTALSSTDIAAMQQKITAQQKLWDDFFAQQQAFFAAQQRFLQSLWP